MIMQHTPLGGIPKLIFWTMDKGGANKLRARCVYGNISPKQFSKAMVFAASRRPEQSPETTSAPSVDLVLFPILRSILLRLHRLFEVRSGLDEASCPSRRFYPYSLSPRSPTISTLGLGSIGSPYPLCGKTLVVRSGRFGVHFITQERYTVINVKVAVKMSEVSVITI